MLTKFSKEESSSIFYIQRLQQIFHVISSQVIICHGFNLDNKTEVHYPPRNIIFFFLWYCTTGFHKFCQAVISSLDYLFLYHICNQCSIFASDCHIGLIFGANYSSRVHSIINQSDLKLNVIIIS